MEGIEENLHVDLFSVMRILRVLEIYSYTTTTTRMDLTTTKVLWIILRVHLQVIFFLFYIIRHAMNIFEKYLYFWVFLFLITFNQLFR